MDIYILYFNDTHGLIAADHRQRRLGFERPGQLPPLCSHRFASNAAVAALWRSWLGEVGSPHDFGATNQPYSTVQFSGAIIEKSGFGVRGSGFGVRDSGFGIRDSGFGARGSGFGIRDSGFGFRDSGFGVRGSGFGNWVARGSGIQGGAQCLIFNSSTRNPKPDPRNPILIRIDPGIVLAGAVAPQLQTDGCSLEVVGFAQAIDDVASV